MEINNEAFSMNKQLTNINLALRDSNLNLAELIGLHSTVEVLIIKNTKYKSQLEAKLGQIENRIIKIKGKMPNLAERLLAVLI